MRYSVIIPSYNAEETISRCLDSILIQLPEDGEIIIVDDGSSDRTLQIINNYALQDRRIRVSTKPNGGVSSARNRGLSLACGTYILFVDSDDEVRPNYFYCIEKYTAYDPDFILFHQDDEFLPGHSELATSSVEETRKVLADALRRQLLNCPWARVFRRDLIEKYGLRFDERLSIGEDKVFVVRYSLKAAAAVFVHEKVYRFYTDNPESLSRKKREDLDDSIILEHRLLFKAAEEAGDPAFENAVTYSFYRSAYSVIRELWKFPISRKQRVQKTRSICRKYCQEKRTQFGSFDDWLVAFPVRLRMANTIDLIIRKKWYQNYR